MEPCRWQGNKNRMYAIRVVWVTMLVGSVVACSTDRDLEARPPRSIVTDVILTIDNQTSRPLVIYLESGTRWDSLGVVPRRANRSFALPSGASDSTSVLRLEARERRTVAVRSQTFQVWSAQQVVWTLDPTRRGTMTMR
jgi:hypothetical protein